MRMPTAATHSSASARPMIIAGIMRFLRHPMVSIQTRRRPVELRRVDERDRFT